MLTAQNHRILEKTCFVLQGGGQKILQEQSNKQRPLPCEIMRGIISEMISSRLSYQIEFDAGQAKFVE
jgi:hypothetical protein